MADGFETANAAPPVQATAAQGESETTSKREDARKPRRPGATRWLKAQAGVARRQVLLCVGAGFANGLLLIAQAALIAHIIYHAVVADASRGTLLPAFAGLLGVVAARAFFIWAAEVTGIAAAAKVKRALRHDIFAHIAALGPRFTSERHSGELTSVVVEQVEALEGYFARFLPQMALAVLIPLAMLAAVFPVNWVVGVILIGTAPLIPLFMAIVGMGAAAANKRQFQALARMSGHFLDRLQGLTTLKLFGQARRELETVARISDQFRRRTMGVLRIAFLSSAVLEFFSSIAVAVVAVYVGLNLLGYIRLGTGDEAISLYVGLFVLILAPDFFVPLRQLAQHYHDRAAAVGAADEIMAILDRPVTAATAPRGTPVEIPAADKLSVAFDAVTVRFSGRSTPALDAVSFTADAGEYLVLAGPSGSGKSTAINLLLGFVTPDSGAVRVGGVDIADADPDGLRERLAWVGQTPRLFHGTIADNIRMGRPDADADAIEQAARAAHVMDFASQLPKGLDTLVGERGLGLSGGQAQRIALARAFVKDSPLLLLDEPTANLDADNEALILDAVDRLAEGRTVIMATHSRTAMARAARVLFLDEGRLAKGVDENKGSRA